MNAKRDTRKDSLPVTKQVTTVPASVAGQVPASLPRPELLRCRVQRPAVIERTPLSTARWLLALGLNVVAAARLWQKAAIKTAAHGNVPALAHPINGRTFRPSPSFHVGLSPTAMNVTLMTGATSQVMVAEADTRDVLRWRAKWLYRGSPVPQAAFQSSPRTADTHVPAVVLLKPDRRRV